MARYCRKNEKCLTLLFCIVWIATVSLYAQENPIDLRGVKVWREAKRIEVQGLVNMNSGLVELLATSPGGKEHESVLVLNCNPALLQTSILLIGLEPGGGGRQLGDDTENIYGDRLYIYVKWNDKMVRAESLVWDQKKNEVMEPTHWIFTGSQFRLGPKRRKQVFMANRTGVLVATFYDPNAIINNPLPNRVDDTVYYANTKVLPKKGTRITLVLSPKELTKKQENKKNTAEEKEKKK